MREGKCAKKNDFSAQKFAHSDFLRNLRQKIKGRLVNTNT